MLLSYIYKLDVSSGVAIPLSIHTLILSHSLKLFPTVSYVLSCICVLYILLIFLHYCLCMGPYDVFIWSSKIMFTCYFYFIRFIPLIHLFLSMVMPQLFIKFFSFMLPQEIPLIISSFQNSRKKKSFFFCLVLQSVLPIIS